MTTFDSIYIQVLRLAKSSYGSNARQIAGIYLSILQMALLFVIGCFFYVFLSQMNVRIMGSGKAWLLFVVIGIFIIFKNWLKYNRKMRTTLDAKYNSKKHASFNYWVLVSIPIICVGLGLLILQAG